MPSKTKGRSGRAVDREIVTDVHGAARRVRANLPGLHRLRLRREEVVPDGETLGVHSIGEAEQPDVVDDRDAGDVEAGVLPEREHVVPDRRIEDIGAGLVAGGDDVVADSRAPTMPAPASFWKRTSWPTLVPETSAPAWSC